MKKVLISWDDIERIEQSTWGIDALEQELEEWFHSQPAAPQWVSVEDGLPPKYRQVFVNDSEYGEARGILGNHDEWFHIFRGSHYQCENVTHWMPMLPVPGVKDEPKP